MEHSTPTQTFDAWVAALAARGLKVLPPSHAVPVELWVSTPEHTVLHFSARGTTVRLHEYDESALTHLILRAECDCAEHRTAGASSRMVLTPAARPLASVELDGAAELGWTGVQAGMLRVADAAAHFDRLHGRLAASRDQETAAVPVPLTA